MNRVDPLSALAKQHYESGRLFADREYTALDRAKVTEEDLRKWSEKMVSDLSRVVKGIHRDNGVPEALDATMALHAVAGFNARLAELLAGPRSDNDN